MASQRHPVCGCTKAVCACVLVDIATCLHKEPEVERSRGRERERERREPSAFSHLYADTYSLIFLSKCCLMQPHLNCCLCLSRNVFLYNHQGIEINFLARHVDPLCLDFLRYHMLLVSIGNAGYLKYHVRLWQWHRHREVERERSRERSREVKREVEREREDWLTHTRTHMLTRALTPSPCPPPPPLVVCALAGRLCREDGG